MSNPIPPAATINSYLVHWSKTDPDTPAFIFRSHDPVLSRLCLTRHDLFSLASRYAAILRRKGVKAGDTVCNTLPNSPERLVTDMGILLAGAATANGAIYLVDGTDLLYSLEKTKCVAIITDPHLLKNAEVILKDKLESDDGERVCCPQLPNLKLLLRVETKLDKDLGVKPFLETLKNGQDKEQFVADAQPSDLAYIMTTSGSTGFSKLVPRTHNEMLKMSKLYHNTCNFQDGDILLNDRSLGWIGGLPFIFLGFKITRIMTDMSSPPPDLLAFTWHIIREEKATIAVMIPVLISMTLARPELWQNDLPLLRTTVCGGQPVNQNQAEAVGKITEQMIIVYGGTEIAVATSLVLTEQNKHDFLDGDNGLPVMSTEVKLVDEKGEEIKEKDQLGEVLVRSDFTFSGYLGLQPDDPVNNFTADGFFRTNDIGFFNRKGHLHIICRRSFAIMHGSRIRYPGWLESQISKCPGIQGVTVVPIPDAVLYQELCACIVSDNTAPVTEESVREFCKSVLLVSPDVEPSAVPRYYVFLDAFPMTSTGKTDRKATRKLALEKLDMEDSALTARTYSF